MKIFDFKAFNDAQVMSKSAVKERCSTDWAVAMYLLKKSLGL
ncbi:hypothetical protein Sf12_gp18 [Shigella phage Sf12]|uniref:Uncharacterized protein n=1 Tax=Shigella phage Sf12 TaxID=2024315 RepID=A0A291AXL1_9CAUD|nr:hypothetical protein HOR99_gp17 [Shigella phage Sf12]ATE85744.1 hypothetical protein Sf12_gp18 [Shigella phage Sf12]